MGVRGDAVPGSATVGLCLFFAPVPSSRPSAEAAAAGTAAARSEEAVGLGVRGTGEGEEGIGAGAALGVFDRAAEGGGGEGEDDRLVAGRAVGAASSVGTARGARSSIRQGAAAGWRRISVRCWTQSRAGGGAVTPRTPRAAGRR